MKKALMLGVALAVFFATPAWARGNACGGPKCGGGGIILVPFLAIYLLLCLYAIVRWFLLEAPKQCLHGLRFASSAAYRVEYRAKRKAEAEAEAQNLREQQEHRAFLSSMTSKQYRQWLKKQGRGVR